MDVASLFFLAELLIKFNQEYSRTDNEQDNIRKVISMIKREIGL